MSDRRPPPGCQLHRRRLNLADLALLPGDRRRDLVACRIHHDGHKIPMAFRPALGIAALALGETGVLRWITAPDLWLGERRLGGCGLAWLFYHGLYS